MIQPLLHLPFSLSLHLALPQAAPHTLAILVSCLLTAASSQCLKQYLWKSGHSLWADTRLLGSLFCLVHVRCTCKALCLAACCSICFIMVKSCLFMLQVSTLLRHSYLACLCAPFQLHTCLHFAFISLLSQPCLSLAHKTTSKPFSSFSPFPLSPLWSMREVKILCPFSLSFLPKVEGRVWKFSFRLILNQ